MRERTYNLRSSPGYNQPRRASAALMVTRRRVDNAARGESWLRGARKRITISSWCISKCAARMFYALVKICWVTDSYRINCVCARFDEVNVSVELLVEFIQETLFNKQLEIGYIIVSDMSTKNSLTKFSQDKPKFSQFYSQPKNIKSNI